MGPITLKQNPQDTDDKQKNWRAFNMNQAPDIKPGEDEEFENKAKAIAEMVYGNGWFEGDKGGKGHIGIIDGKVIKFNTKKKERDELDKMKKIDASMKARDKDSEGFVTYREMKESCNNLRRELFKMAETANMKTEDFQKVLSALGMEANGSISANAADLLERTTVSAVLKRIVAAYNDCEANKTKILIGKLWSGSTPTYGSSVASFRAEINKHNADVFQTVKQESDKLVKDAILKSEEIGKVHEVITAEIKDKIGGWCGHVEKWLGRMRDFLIGLVPETAKNAKALEELCSTLKSECRKIKNILDAMKDLAAHGTPGNYTTDVFGEKGKTYSTLPEVMVAGFKAVESTFNGMLFSAHLGPKFSDGKSYPDFTKSLDNQEIPKAYKDIAGDISVMCSTFRSAINSFMYTEKEATMTATEQVGFSNWNKEFDQRVGNAANAFDKKLEELEKSTKDANQAELPNQKEMSERMEKLAVIEKNAKPDQLKGLAQSLKDMWKATFMEEKETENSTYNKLHTSFNTGTNLTYSGKKFDKDHEPTYPDDRELQSAVDNIKTKKDFEGFVKMLTLTERLGGKGGIFDMTSHEDPSVPPAFPRGLATTNTKRLVYGIKMGNEEGKMTMTAMRYFNRLHDVAQTFKVIDGLGWNHQ